MTFQIQIPLATFPISLFCRGDAKIALQPSQNFKYFTDGVASFDMTGFTIDNVQYSYEEYLDYKNIPSLLKWLQSLNMEMPSFQQNPFGGLGFN